MIRGSGVVALMGLTAPPTFPDAWDHDRIVEGD